MVHQSIPLRSNIHNRLSRIYTKDLVSSAVFSCRSYPKVQYCTCLMHLNKIPSRGRSKISLTRCKQPKHILFFLSSRGRKIQISLQAQDSLVMGRNDPVHLVEKHCTAHKAASRGTGDALRNAGGGKQDSVGEEGLNDCAAFKIHGHVRVQLRTEDS